MEQREMLEEEKGWERSEEGISVFREMFTVQNP